MQFLSHWFYRLLSAIPRPEPLPKPHPDFPDPRCRSCDVLLHGWNHNRVPMDVHCCTRCWAKVPVAERLKYAVQLDDRAPDGAIAGWTALVRDAILNRETQEHGHGQDDDDDREGY